MNAQVRVPDHSTLSSHLLSDNPLSDNQWYEQIQQYIAAQKQPAVYGWISKTLNLTNSVSSKVAGKLAHKLWFTPQSRPMSEADKDWLNSAVTDYVIKNGAQVPVYHWGSGPQILCIHGWGGHSGQFRQIANTLVEQGYSVISFDSPGHGFAEGKTTDLQEISEIVSLIAESHVQAHGEFHAIVTHSLGGLAANNAINNGVKTKSLVCLNTPMCLDHTVQTFKHQLSLHSEVIDQHRTLLEKKFNEGFWKDYDLRIKETAVPMFLCYDNKDDQVPNSVGHYLNEQHENSELFLTEGLGHNRSVRTPEVIVKVARFIKSHA